VHIELGTQSVTTWVQYQTCGACAFRLVLLLICYGSRVCYYPRAVGPGVGLAVHVGAPVLGAMLVYGAVV